MSTSLIINRNIVTWAIERAGYDVTTFINDFPSFRIKELLSDNKTPTLKQLESFSTKVHIPFGYLFLTDPPVERLLFPFFRSKSQTGSISLNLYDTVSLIQRRQEWLKEYLTDIDFEPLQFVGKYDVDTDYKTIVADIRQTLKISEDWACHHINYENALNYIADRVEIANITIVFNSIVENNTSRPISVDEFSGFVMVDHIAPFMFVNSADGKAAQLFTIIHELAHIWIGVSAGFNNESLLPADDPIEILCDKVAAEFLVPEHLFIIAWNRKPSLDTLSRYFKVSKIVVARRALDLQKLTKDQFFSFYNEYTNQVQYKKDNQGSGGDFYATAKKRVGLRFVGLVNQAIRENKLLYKEAYKITGLKGDTYQKFVDTKLFMRK